MEGDRERGKRPGRWEAGEWRENDWGVEEKPPKADAPPVEDPRPGGFRGSVGIKSDLRNIMDDPLYEARRRESASRGHRLSARPGQSDRAREKHAGGGLSLGQKFLLWLGFALVSGISFGAGLIVGASGGLDVPRLPFFDTGTGEVEVPGGLDALGPAPDAEGIIAFGERGTVPSKDEAEGPGFQPETGMADTGVEPEPPAERPRPAETRATAPPEEKPSPAPASKPAAAKTAAEEPRKAVEAPKADAAKQAEAPAGEAPAEMTFYETATGESAMPGLARTEEGAEDDAEAPPDPAPAGVESALSEADVAAARPAETPPGAAPAMSDLPKIDSPAPSGAELLARRQIGAATSGQGSALAGGGARSGETYTVQVTTLADRTEAERMVERLKTKGFDARIAPLSRSGLGTLYRIRVGRYPSEEAARRDLAGLRAEPGAHPYIRME